MIAAEQTGVEASLTPVAGQLTRRRKTAEDRTQGRPRHGRRSPVAGPPGLSGNRRGTAACRCIPGGSCSPGSLAAALSKYTRQKCTATSCDQRGGNSSVAIFRRGGSLVIGVVPRGV